MTKKYDPAHAAKRGYTRADWDSVDSPELSDEQIAKAQPFRKAAPALAARMDDEIARRGRPPAENPKVAVSMRLDADLVEALRAGGKGWQTRANAALRKALRL